MSLLSTASTEEPLPLPQRDAYYSIRLANHPPGKFLFWVEHKGGALNVYRVLLGGDLGDKIGTLVSNANNLIIVRDNGAIDVVIECKEQVVRPLTREDRLALYQLEFS